MIRWAIILALLAGSLVGGRHQIRKFLFGVEPPPKNDPSGEWVGQLDITGEYVPSVWGDTPGPHKKAAIRFTLAMYDGFLERYAGKGELFIVGELKPRSIEILDLRIRADGTVTIRMDSNPKLAHKFDGQLKSNEMILNQDEWGLRFHGVMHRGNDADYETILHNLH